MTPKRILIASHGTPGARAAEKAALALCPRGGTLSHLIVVPDFWKGMQGDDWLNNAATRDVFARYVESTLEGEVRAEVTRLSRLAASRGLRYRPTITLGDPTQCLIDRAAKGADLVVIGAPRPRGRAGLRSRLDTEKLARALKVPLMIIPHPK
ncbi:MAG TPA: universal stress protein [Acidiferrobacterales bacterium]